jgi:hypothetical protein
MGPASSGLWEGSPAQNELQHSDLTRTGLLLPIVAVGKRGAVRRVLDDFAMP